MPSDSTLHNAITARGGNDPAEIPKADAQLKCPVGGFTLSAADSDSTLGRPLLPQCGHRLKRARSCMASSKADDALQDASDNPPLVSGYRAACLKR